MQLAAHNDNARDRTCNVCGEAPCINPTFCRLCRTADRKFPQAHRDTEVAWRRALIEDSVSAERAYTEVNRRDHAAASTVEAVMYSLRERGVNALQEPDTRRRLRDCSKGHLCEVSMCVQNFKPDIAPAWSPDDVATLIVSWNELHE